MLNNEHIDALIAAYLSGNAEPEVAMNLEEWRLASPENEAYFNAAEKAFSLSGIPNAFKEPNVEAAWEKVHKHINNEAKIIPFQNKKTYLRIAASVMLVAGLSALLFFYFKNTSAPAKEYIADKGEKTVKLDDQTEIKLLQDAQLSISENFGKTNRTVKLKGNAYFSVTHQTELPFTIDAGKVYIKDIGTKFNVRFSPDTDTVFVNVDEGVVLLFDSLGAELEIKATERALYIKSKKQIITANHASGAEKQTPLIFSNERLQDVINQLNVRFHVSVSLANSKLKDCRITTRFQNEDLETILSVICETLGLNYTQTSDGYIISGQSCSS